MKIKYTIERFGSFYLLEAPHRHKGILYVSGRRQAHPIRYYSGQCHCKEQGQGDNFNANYLKLTQQVAQSCENHDILDSMVIGTSAMTRYEIDGAHASAFLDALQREIDRMGL